MWVLHRVAAKNDESFRRFFFFNCFYGRYHGKNVGRMWIKMAGMVAVTHFPKQFDVKMEETVLYLF